MAAPNLKNIIGRKKDAGSLMISFVEQYKSDVSILDETGNWLAGKPPDDAWGFRVGVFCDEKISGWVTGNEKAVFVAEFLSFLLKKENDKKNLGTEVLHLYKEINLIFNFSEKLARSIEASSIAQITLEESMRVIRSTNGVVILWDESSKHLSVIASAGNSFFNEEKVNDQREILLKIALHGQSDIISDTRSLAEAGLVSPDINSVIYAALKVNQRVMGAVILGSNEPGQYVAADLKLLITLALQSSSTIETALLYEKNLREVNEREEAMRLVYEVTGKFVPYEFIGALGHRVITDVRLGDQVEKIVTVLFSDIRDYTTISEQLTPEENFNFVSSFNERMGPIIRKNQGFINQYLGDAIMAIFPGNATHALTAAIEMQKAVQTLNENRSLLNKTPIKIGVGIHTGPLIMGITGDHERLDATTISDTVNIASRLENLTKHYKGNIILSEASLKNITDLENFHYRHLGLVKLKGKENPLSIYECFSGTENPEFQKKIATLPIFKRGMTGYLNKSFEEAYDEFHQVLQIHPEDLTTRLFVDNIKHFINQGVPENWTGINEMHSK